MKYANGRMMVRSRGRFARQPSLEEMGFDVNSEERTCRNCGHKCIPLLISGTCPACSTERAFVPTAPAP